jgi:uncharacterized caspase-like protein
MSQVIRFLLAATLLLALASFSTLRAQQPETRIALVIGNSGYQAGGPVTAANDAGLVAQTLQAAGFDVVGARDLDLDSLRRAFRDFLDKASAAGPSTVAFIYFAGYGLQLEGENYLVPVDARLARDTDVPVEALRLTDYTKALAALRLKAMLVVLDAARRNPFVQSGQPLASGLALIDPDPGVLIAFNAAPGTVAPDEQGPYGAYAHGLIEMIREGGLPVGDMFDRLRLRVNEETNGADVPWDVSAVDAPFVFFERTADAPSPAVSDDQVASYRSRPIRDLDAQEAYLIALQRDTLPAYEEFIGAYPDDPMARRVRVIIAARREALVWRRTYLVATPAAYWSYLRRYPRGPHAFDARRRLARLAAALEPPRSFAAISYDVPPPPDEEMAVFVDRPVLVFDDPTFGFEAPPPPPVYLLPPPPPELVVLPPPPPPTIAFVLPVPVFFNPPRYVAPPPNNVIFANIHTSTVVNGNAPAGGVAAAAAAAPPSLPPSLAKKASLQPVQAGPGAAPGQGAAGTNAPGAALPGVRPGSLAPGVAPSGQTRRPGPAGAQPAAVPGGKPPPSAATPPALGNQATATPGTPPGTGAKKPAQSPGTAQPAPSRQAPSASLPAPAVGNAATPPAAAPPRTPVAPAAALPRAPPAPAAAPSHAPLAPTAALPRTPPPPAAPTAAAPPVPPAAATRASPQQPPVARTAAPPPPAAHAPPPAAHAAPPATAAAAKPALPSCPAGKTAEVVNGQHVCR